MLDLAGRRVLVLGLGVSGRSTAAFCAQRGASVCAADERPADDVVGLEPLPPGVDVRLGSPFPDPAEYDLVIASPGVPAERYRDRAKRVWGDVELAWRAIEAPVIAVTGTNGKSTTVLLVEAMLRAAGACARAAGNVGIPALELVGEALDFAVLEVSSFQLETTEDFRPAVAVVLNLTADHLDRHGSLEGYARAKQRIFANQRDDDVVVLNVGDPELARWVDLAPARVVPFRTSGALQRGAWLDMGAAVLTDEAGASIRIPLDGMRLVGRHNLENALASLAAVQAAGVDPVTAAQALATFRGLPHRSELVAEVAGVRFVNDSKATNPGAALRSLEGFGDRVVWIAGGRDKDLAFDELADAAVKRARAAVLIGEGAEKLAAAIGGRIEVHHEASLADAVRCAAGIARRGDVVLLAPACASQDQFRDFEHRGDSFRAAVEALDDASIGGGR